MCDFVAFIAIKNREVEKSRNREIERINLND